MHELSICRRIIQLIEEKQIEYPISAVSKVVIELGELGWVSSNSLLFSFEIVAKNTIANGAKLAIISIPGEGFCSACNQKQSLHHRYQECVNCGEYGLQITSGDQVRVKSIEVL